MRQRARRDFPDKFRGGPHILGERALVREGTAVHEARDVCPDNGRRHILANTRDDAREVDTYKLLADARLEKG